MKIRNPTKECKLVDLETMQVVGICVLNNRNNFLKLKVNPMIDGVRYNKIIFILCTKRPYLVYESANVVEINGIKKLLEPKIKKFKEIITNSDISYVKAYIEINEGVIMKEDKSLKKKYDEYLEVQQKISKIKQSNFDLEEYKKLLEKKEELSKTLRTYNLIK